MIKLKVRYAAAKKSYLLRDEEKLEKGIHDLQISIESNHMTGNDEKKATDALEAKNAKLDKIIEYHTRGAMLRAKCRWHNEGKKNTKCF